MAAKVAVKKLVELSEVPTIGASKFASKLSVFDGDMTSLKIDCVVNDVESDFSNPKAITNVLHQAAGHEMKNFCKQIGKCPVGSVVLGKGFNLPSKWVIHTATPTISYQRIHANEEEEKQLTSCYTNALEKCMQKGIRSIAFPSLATRSHRYPLDEATRVGMKVILKTLEEKGDMFDRIILCTHMGKDSKVVNGVVQDCLKELETVG